MPILSQLFSFCSEKFQRENPQKIREKVKFEFQKFQHELLAPGDIFWIKKSGRTLVSKKGDMLNYALLKKLDEAGHTLMLENEIHFHMHDQLAALYEKYSGEFLMKDKIKWREEFIAKLKIHFVEEGRDQSELNYLAWRLFSRFNREDGVAFLERDSELFKRNLSVASAYTICAFLLGYYETQFLQRIFTSTLQNLMMLGTSVSVITLKEQLEYLRLQDSFNEEDVRMLGKIAAPELIQSSVIFEKYNGSGVRNINSREMSDLDIVMVALSRFYGFKLEVTVNVLKHIENGELACERRTLRTLQNVLFKRYQTENEAVG